MFYHNFYRKTKHQHGKKSEFHMGFEPTILRDLVGCSNHWATGDSMVSKSEVWVHHAVTEPNDVLVHMNSLTALRSHIKAYQRCNQSPSKVSIIWKFSK